MLRLHTSNRLETLAEHLAETLRRPLRSPLQPEVVVVQSQGMARWLKLELAVKLGVCANYSFPFPKVFCSEVLAAHSGRARHSVRAVRVIGRAHRVTRPVTMCRQDLRAENLGKREGVVRAHAESPSQLQLQPASHAQIGRAHV